MRLEIRFKSPFIVGGKKLTSNYIESLDYIPGDVVRAAFARHILNNCPGYKKGEVVEIDGVNKVNWVHFRNGVECYNCGFRDVCKSFSNIKFSFFYPKDSCVLPMTAMKCKAYEEHGFIDSLIEKKRCTRCNNMDGRVEFTTGLVRNGKSLKVYKRTYTRASINPYTKTSMDGNLYSLIAVEATSNENENLENVYEGYIEGLDCSQLNLLKNVRIGSYISVGFGLCTLNDVGNIINNDSNIPVKMGEFNKKYIENNKKDPSYAYFAIKFTSDAKLNFQFGSEYIPTSEYRRIWQEAIGLDKGYEIDLVYAETFNYRGYDLSIPGEDQRELPSVMIEKGSVVVVKTRKAFDEAYIYVSGIKGFGMENINGFGDFKLHFGGVE